ncbi:MAG: ATP-binding cassette domain-containing protein [Boseongicola sp. SB0675_bin_26]|nr:ATP-binding cassette domain-containing protein [Boseongicola sp. SB0675_bin_26]
MPEHTDRNDATGTGARRIELRALAYDVAGTRLIDVPALTLRPTGTTVVMGPNGAGKSLLLRLMHGLIRPSAGEILVGGRPLSPRQCKAQALVFQKPVLLRRSTVANIDFVLKARGKDRSRSRSLLDRVDLAALADRPARRLSGGEQQRLAIARALATEPDTLFLDEPTASLDPESVQAIEGIVAAAARDGVRIIFVTHDVQQARRLADDVVFLSNGRVAEEASAAAFFNGPETDVARAYLSGHLDRLVET